MRSIHELHRRLHERAFYPHHGKRRETAAYRRVREILIVEKNLPCLVCGVTNADLAERRSDKNPYGARAMETHHHVVEWALADAVDVGKFNERIVRHLRQRPHSDPIYRRDFTCKQVRDWIDHHPDNLWVLCDVHHRHKWVGVHAVSGPIWGPQDLLKLRFRQSVTRALRSSC